MGTPHAPIDIRWFKTRDFDAEAEVLGLPERPRERALALFDRLSRKSKSQFRIKPTYVGNIFEAKLELPEGGLRLLFVYGKSNAWCIGAFIKPDDKKGNRALKSYLTRSQTAENS